MSKLKTRTICTIGGLVVLIIAVGVFAVFNYMGRQEISTDTPANIVLDFYQPWLQAAQSTSTDPYKEGLAQSPILSKFLRKHLQNASQSPDGVDPVLCQSALPTRIATRVIYEVGDKSEVLVTARPVDFSFEQAIVTLLSRDGGWYIDDIRCSPGEFGPDREFTFDQEGNLLKNVPEPFNSQNWHLVFKDNIQQTNAVPLFFNSESTCRTLDGNVSVCKPDTFIETAKAQVQGEMTEAGVEVKHMELKK